MNDRTKGKIRYSLAENPQISLQDIAEQEGVPSAIAKVELHDRCIKVHYQGGYTFSFSFGKGLATFDKDRNKFIKNPGIMSYYIRQTENREGV